MKHFRKVCSVLLAVVMLAVVVPSFINVSTPIEAAEAGVITNGGFENGDGTGWSPSAYGVTIGTSSSYRRSGSYGCRLSKDGSHNGNEFLTQVVPVNTNATYTFSFYVKSVKTDCDYVACFTYSLDLGTTASGTGTSLVANQTVNPGGTSWTKISYTVNTGSNKYLKIRFIGTGVGSGDCGLDDIALTATNEGDTGTHAKPSLVNFATDKNRPNSDANNIIVQPGFESTTNAQWNTSAFLTNGVQVKEDASIAHSGSKYLYYYRGNVAVTNWSMFEITCPTAGNYVFSAWVRTPHLSSTNTGKASIGVIDRDTGKFLTYGDEDYFGHYSTDEIQIRSTATDDDWHLRSVVFYVGAANSNVKIGMYGLQSTMYVDDISVHKLENGVTYEGNQKGSLSVSSTSVTNKYCEADKNLIADCNMNSDMSKDFWMKSSGWNNGFLNFQTDAQSAPHGNTLHYKGTNPGSNKLYNYIKFVYVEPNTSYTVSFDYRVAAAGNQLMFIDNNIESPQVFHTPSLRSASNSYKTYAFTFNSGNYKRIGIVFRDHASAELYFDDFRFFKTSDGIATEPEEEIFPTLKHDEKVPMSRMEMTETGKLGLAFRFNLKSTGVDFVDKFDEATQKFVDSNNDGIIEPHVGDYTNGKVQAFEDGVDYKLVAAGAVLTNDSTVGQDEAAFKRDNTNAAKTVIDVNATYLYNTYHKEFLGIEDNGITYAVRITNIPESHISTVIYARPYYIFEYNGRQITVYGDISFDSYKEMTDVNDGWLEWG